MRTRSEIALAWDAPALGLALMKAAAFPYFWGTLGLLPATTAAPAI